MNVDPKELRELKRLVLRLEELYPTVKSELPEEDRLLVELILLRKDRIIQVVDDLGL